MFKEISYLWVSGWINKETTIDFTIYLDEGGSFTSQTQTISGDGDYVTELPSTGFGLNAFGINNFSNVEGDSDNLLHFAGYIGVDDLFDKKWRNIQFGISSTGVDQNYRLNKVIFYVNLLNQTWCQEYDFCWID